MNYQHLTTIENVASFNASKFRDISLMQQRCPSLFAKYPSPRMSGGYGFTDTYLILDNMLKRGFTLDAVQQTGKGSFGKLMVRMSHPDLYADADSKMQLIIFDSHDGTAAFSMRLGNYRFVCANGMIVGDDFYMFHAKHTQPDLMAQVMLETDDMLTAGQNANHMVQRLRNRIATVEEIKRIAFDVAKTRFDFDTYHEYERSISALTPRRRKEDTSNDLYTIMNVVQENAVRGGHRYTYNGMAKVIKPIGAIGLQTRVNEAAWDIAVRVLVGI